ncbi:MAG: hypothetical protein QG639_642 [Patescibacteria group bacterium]|nr:hypothetical protein [Patescibacteria group bacterium]
MAYYTDPNQTKFSLEEPLFEQTGQIPGPENPEIVEKTPLLKQKKFVIALIAGVTLLVLIVLFMINAYIASQKRVQEQGPPETTIEQVSDPNHPLYQRIKSAQQELKEADPSEQDLVYPTLDYGIRLED